MFRNSHATVGQSQGRVVLSARKRAGSSATPGRSGVSPRFGLSLTEVLISMGILTMGLLGVASVFPVASFYMQKGDIADRGSAIAQGAFNEALANGTLNPENWMVWTDSSVINASNGLGTTFTFTRPFAEMLRRSKTGLVTSGANAATVAQQVTREFGSFFMIDPIGVASLWRYNPGTNNPVGVAGSWPGGNFPCGSPVLAATNTEWQPWEDPNASKVGIQWPVRRVTLRDIPTGSANAMVASKRFSTADDLALNLPGGQSKPSVQSWDVAPVDLNGDGNLRNDLLARQSRGDYSWVITVAPTTATGRDGLATEISANSYEISVVVFHKRPVGVTSPPDNTELSANRNLLSQNERVVRAKVVSTGLNGGEVLLERYGSGATADQTVEDPFTNLKTGNWVLLCGPHPNTSAERPLLTARWYRVLAIEGKDEKLDSSGNVTSGTQPERRLVSLRGPEWPWQPALNGAGNPDLTNYSHLSNSLYVCIPTGAVAVHAKTIRLEGNSVWSGGAGGLAPPPPEGTGPKLSGN